MSYLATQVWFVHEYNDRADIAAGGSPWLGPWVLIPNNYLSQFLEHARTKYSRYFGVKPHIKTGEIIECENECPSYEKVFNYAENFLGNIENWGLDNYVKPQPISQEQIVLMDKVLDSVEKIFLSENERAALNSYPAWVKKVILSLIGTKLTTLPYVSGKIKNFMGE